MDFLNVTVSSHKRFNTTSSHTPLNLSEIHHTGNGGKSRQNGIGFSPSLKGPYSVLWMKMINNAMIMWSDVPITWQNLPIYVKKSIRNVNTDYSLSQAFDRKSGLRKPQIKNP